MAPRRFATILFSCGIACQARVIAFTQETRSTNLNCSFDLDCVDPLVCAFGNCHAQCVTSRDCSAGQRCVQVRSDDAGALLGNVCLQPIESRCTINSDCPAPLICGIDGQCREECLTTRDCSGMQVCATHTCADPTEVDDAGMFTERPDAAADVSGF